MRRLFTFFVPLLLLQLLLGCSVFVVELPWATGYFAESPGNVNSINVSYIDNGLAVRLDWDPVDYAQIYKVEYWVEGNSSKTIDIPSAITKCDLQLADIAGDGLGFTATNNDFYYRVSAVNNNGASVTPIEGNFVPLGAGTPGDPFKVFDRNTFLAMSGNASGEYYALLTDIDLGGLDPTTEQFILQASFDGQNNQITYSMTGTGYTGLFEMINGGKVSSLYVEGTITTTGLYNGILTARNEGDIDNCHATGTISGNHSSSGGLVGFIQNAGNVIENSSATNITINGGFINIGGFIGETSGGTIQNSYCSATVNSTGEYIGGFVGNHGSGGSIYICYSKGTINLNSSGNQYRIGGFVGSSSGTNLNNCYTTVTISDNGNSPVVYYLGGFIGSHNSGNIYNSYSSGQFQLANIQASSERIAGFCGSTTESGDFINSISMVNNLNVNSSVDIGYFTGTIVSNVSEIYRYSSMNFTNPGSVDNNAGASNLTTTQFQNSSSTVFNGGGIYNWDFTNTWQMSSEGPILRNMPGNPTQDPLPWS